MPPTPPANKQRGNGSTLFFALLAIIVLALAAFLITHPRGSGNSGTPTTQH